MIKLSLPFAILLALFGCSTWDDLSQRAVIDLQELKQDPNYCQGQIWQLEAPKQQLDLQVVEASSHVITFHAQKVPIYRRAYQELKEPQGSDYELGFELVNTHVDELFINWNESYFIGPDGRSSRLYPSGQEITSFDDKFNFSKISGNERVKKTYLPFAYLQSGPRGIEAKAFGFRQIPGQKVGLILTLQRHMRPPEKFAYQFKICAH